MDTILNLKLITYCDYKSVYKVDFYLNNRVCLILNIYLLMQYNLLKNNYHFEITK